MCAAICGKEIDHVNQIKTVQEIIERIVSLFSRSPICILKSPSRFSSPLNERILLPDYCRTHYRRLVYLCLVLCTPPGAQSGVQQIQDQNIWFPLFQIWMHHHYYLLLLLEGSPYRLLLSLLQYIHCVMDKMTFCTLGEVPA